MRYLILVLLLLSSVSAETMYYGLVLYKNIPMSGLEVTAYFTDEDDNFNSVATHTLDKNEAYQRSNVADTGYYFFEKGQIDAKTGTNIVFTFGNYPYSIIITPSKESSYRVNTISFDYGNPGTASQSGNVTTINEPDEEKEYIKNIVESKNNSELGDYSVPEKNISVLYEKSNEELGEPENIVEQKKEAIVEKNRFSEIFLLVVGIAVAFALLFVVFGLVKSGIGYISQNISLASPESLARKIVRLKIKEIYNSTELVSSEIKLADALENFTDNEIIFIKKENYKGYIKREDLLKLPSLEKKMNELKVHDEKISLDSEKNVIDALNLMRNHKINRICVSEKSDIIGELSLRDLQQAFSISKMNLGNIPKIREHLDRNIFRINKGESVDAAIKIMSEKNAMILNVVENGKVIGIFSMHEFVTGLLKYRNEVRKQLVESLMLSNFPKADAEMDILDANNFLIEKNMRFIPVIVHDEIIGILSDEKIASAIADYLLGI